MALGHNPGDADLSGSSTNLSARAARSHPGGLTDCTCLRFIDHAGFTLFGGLTVLVGISGPEPVYAFALRLAPCAFPGFANPVAR